MNINFKGLDFLKYEHFKINFKGLIFDIKLIDNEANFPNTDDKKPIEQFKVSVYNGNKKISYNFYNSQMEKEISDYLNNLRYLSYSNKEFKEWFKRFSWGGYDDVKNKRDLTNKRIYHLFYSIINTFAGNENDDYSSFNFFCDNFGYEKDSRRAEKIFNECVELQEKIYSLCIDGKIIKYLREEANQETDKFSKDIKEAINKAEEI